MRTPNSLLVFLVLHAISTALCEHSGLLSDSRRRRPCQWRGQKNNLIEAAQFGRLDQMLSTIV